MYVPTGEQKISLEKPVNSEKRAPTPQRAQSPSRASLDAHHQPSNIVLHSPLPPPQNRQFVLSTSGPQAPGMPIILAPRPLSDKEPSLPQSLSEPTDDLSLKMASTTITGGVPEVETTDIVETESVTENEEPSSGEKMPKIMTNTVYDI